MNTLTTTPAKRRPSRPAEQAIAHNFHAYLGCGMASVEHLSMPALIAKIDCEQYEIGSRYVIVSKQTGARCYATTVLDTASKALYRAPYQTGMVSFWKGVAAKSGGRVQLLAATEAYDPSRAPRDLKKPRPKLKSYRAAKETTGAVVPRLELSLLPRNVPC